MKFLLVLLLLVLCISLVTGQVGTETKSGESDQVIDENGNIHPRYKAMAQKLQSIAPIDPVTAAEMSVLLDASKSNPETIELVLKMRNGDAEGIGADFAAFVKDATPIEIVKGMAESLSELKAVEILFQDPQRAVTEMEKEGLLDKKKLKHYKKHPEDLESDTRKGIYFTFVTLAAAGDFL